MRNRMHRIGAVSYALWGVIHVIGGAAMLTTLGSGGGVGLLGLIGTGVPAGASPEVPGRVATSVLAFHAWNLLWVGAFVLAIAMMLNWRNRLAGYWINLAVVAAVDGGLVVTTLQPGVMRVVDAVPGLVLFALGIGFTTAGALAGSARASREGREPLATAAAR